MNIRDFKILTDENIQVEVVDYLRSLSFDVKDVKEQSLNGSSDKTLFEIAYNENRVILTHDSDFGKIIFSGDIRFTGIMYLRTGHFHANYTISSINTLLQQNIDLEIPFILTIENYGETVEICYDGECFDACVNRAYYAVYQIVIVALAKIKITSEKNEHKWVQSNFCNELINKRKWFPANFKADYNCLLEWRNYADYDERQISKNKSQIQFAKAKNLFETIQNRIKS